ncbi:MAG: hypothetical protein M1610_01290 [Nitrospirae bacterium]|nr:hypothetical protein [Nitrospirota bacterium]MDA8338616.1 hypothetical protein [Nitrospiraceae bacterium]
MYIKKEDFNYFEGLYKSLDEAKRKRFLEILLKAGSKRAGTDISKIQVVGDEIYNERGIDPNEMVTRTMIKKAYKAVKDE